MSTSFPGWILCGESVKEEANYAILADEVALVADKGDKIVLTLKSGVCVSLGKELSGLTLHRVMIAIRGAQSLKNNERTQEVCQPLE